MAYNPNPVILESGSTLIGDYAGNVLVRGTATLTGNVSVEGDLVVEGLLTNSGGYSLTVSGDCFCQGFDFTPTSSATPQSNVTIGGDFIPGETLVMVNGTVSNGSIFNSQNENYNSDDSFSSIQFTSGPNQGPTYTGSSDNQYFIHLSAPLSGIVNNQNFDYVGISSGSGSDQTAQVNSAADVSSPVPGFNNGDSISLTFTSGANSGSTLTGYYNVDGFGPFYTFIFNSPATNPISAGDTFTVIDTSLSIPDNYFQVNPGQNPTLSIGGDFILSCAFIANGISVGNGLTISVGGDVDGSVSGTNPLYLNGGNDDPILGSAGNGGTLNVGGSIVSTQVYAYGGAAVNSGNSAGNGGTIGANGIKGNSYTGTYGGNASTNGAVAGNGGNITCNGDLILPESSDSVDAYGGNLSSTSGSYAGNGGNVVVSGKIVANNINVYGGNSVNSAGGDAGTITSNDISTNAINAHGGNSTHNGNGGHGGTLTISGSLVNAGVTNLNGGNFTGGSAFTFSGGNGGTISVTGHTDFYHLMSTDGGSTNGLNSHGGTGGPITLGSYSGPFDIGGFNYATIESNGGNSTTSGNGGNAGTITISSGGVAGVNANGGSAAANPTPTTVTLFVSVGNNINPGATITDTTSGATGIVTATTSFNYLQLTVSITSGTFFPGDSFTASPGSYPFPTIEYVLYPGSTNGSCGIIKVQQGIQTGTISCLDGQGAGNSYVYIPNYSTPPYNGYVGPAGVYIGGSSSIVVLAVQDRFGVDIEGGNPLRVTYLTNRNYLTSAIGHRTPNLSIPTISGVGQTTPSTSSIYVYDNIEGDNIQITGTFLGNPGFHNGVLAHSGIQELVVMPAAAATPTGTTQTIYWSDGNVQELDLGSASGSVTVTFGAPYYNGAIYKLFVVQGVTPQTVTFTGVVWQGATYAATQVANAIDLITFVVRNNTIYGVIETDSPIGQYLYDNHTEFSIDLFNRLLIANDGTTTNVDWSNPGRTLISGATDDLTSALQVNGAINIGNGALLINVDGSIGSGASNAHPSNSIAIGLNSIVGSGGYNSVAIGYGNFITANGGSVIGSGNTGGYYSAAVGYVNNAFGHFSSAFGVGSAATAAYSSAFGYTAVANGFHSVALGVNITAANAYSTVIGSGVVDYFITDANAVGGITLGGYNSTIEQGENWFGIVPGTTLGTARLLFPVTAVTDDGVSAVQVFGNITATGTGAFNSAATQTTLTGMAGTAVCNQPFQGSTYKKVMLRLTGYTDTGTQTYTFPTPFVNIPDYFVGVGATGSTVVATTTTVTVTSTAATGTIVLEGY